MDVGIIGGAGYTGGELIRLLLHHPNAQLTAIHSRSNAGNNVASVHGITTGSVLPVIPGNPSRLTKKKQMHDSDSSSKTCD